MHQAPEQEQCEAGQAKMTVSCRLQNECKLDSKCKFTTTYMEWNRQALFWYTVYGPDDST